MAEPGITRREAFRRLAAGSAALALGGGTTAAPGGGATAAPGGDRFALRYILASSLYGKMKLAEILPEVRKTGADHIDIWPRHHADQREQIDAMGQERFADLLRQHKVRLGMITRYDLGPFGLRDEIRFLHKFGGTLIVTGSRGPKGLSGAECKKAVKLFVEEMKPHVEAAQELGVTIGIENHANALVCSPDSLRYLAEFVTSSHLGVALAPYHLPQDSRLIAGLIKDLASRMVHFYAWQHGQGCHEKMPKARELEQMPGRGSLDFRPILASLREIRYRGWTEVFMHPFPRGIPIHETAARVTDEVNRARRYLEERLREA